MQFCVYKLFLFKLSSLHFNVDSLAELSTASNVLLKFLIPSHAMIVWNLYGAIRLVR